MRVCRRRWARLALVDEGPFEREPASAVGRRGFLVGAGAAVLFGTPVDPPGAGQVLVASRAALGFRA